MDEGRSGQHRRTHSATVGMQVLPNLKTKTTRMSLDSQDPDLIATAIHTTFSPASAQGRFSSEASSAARFFRTQRSPSDSADGSGWSAGRMASMSGERRPCLDVGFEGLGLKLKSCGKVVLQGVRGCLEHGRLAAVMGPSGAVLGNQAQLQQVVVSGCFRCAFVGPCSSRTLRLLSMN